MVRFVTPLDDADFDEWYAAYVAAFDRPFDAPWLPVEKRVNLTDDEYGVKHAVTCRHDDQIVGGGALHLPLKDNRDLAYIELFVHPDHRRRGHGSAILEVLADLARSNDRSRLFGEALWGVDETTSPSRDFAEARGFVPDMIDAVRQLDLPATLPPAPVAERYTLESWRGACPERWLDEYAELRRRLNSEAPSGDIGLEDEHWDAERVRRDEADTERSRRTMQVVVARHDSGHLAGHTQLSFPADSPEVYQWDTLVLPEHRGHGLGLSLKVEAMRLSADLLVGRSRVTTYNAASNAPMIAVNERLGFHQVAWCGEYVRDVSG